MPFTIGGGTSDGSGAGGAEAALRALGLAQRLGLLHRAGRDGHDEPWSTGSIDNGVEVRIGDPDRMLDPGEHSYTIRYHATRMIGRFKDYDELYWNVTGNGWMFPIDQAGIQIHLPKPVKFGQRAFYTGPQGSTESAAEVIEEKPGQITMARTLWRAPSLATVLASPISPCLAVTKGALSTDASLEWTEPMYRMLPPLP